MPALTIENHVETGEEFRLCVRIPDTAPEVFAGVAGTAIADGDDTLFTTTWSTDVDPEEQRRETRLLIEHALTTATTAPAEPIEVTAPGTEL
jgi:hypothetical protein